MSVPSSCTVLVVGGGPAGSFAAAALARESINVVLLEAQKFPRYHIGESLLPSTRSFLKIIDCYETFDAHGFTKKNGATFHFNRSQPEAYTNFIATDKSGYAWNVVRSEADELLLRHAGACGAQIIEETKVNAIGFKSGPTKGGTRNDDIESGANFEKPVSATWSRKDGSSGTILFDYLIDASGRQGLLSTKYLKNRTVNPNLKNIADWGYWKGGTIFAPGTKMEGTPYFEALQDASGWCWYIPLHNGTASVGIVQNQESAVKKKRRMGSPSTMEFYLHSLSLAPSTKQLLSNAELVGGIKSAADWSYYASTYAIPGARICGDAGCFIDPLFSSGVHMAIVGGLSAAVTIAASIKGNCSEETAISWHSRKISESYMRFFLVVTAATNQIRAQDEPIIRDSRETGFDTAFEIFKPVIQGTADADAHGTLSPEDILKAVRYCVNTLTQTSSNSALIQKLKTLRALGLSESSKINAVDELREKLTEAETRELKHLLHFAEDVRSIDSFTICPIDGLIANLGRGQLGLVNADKTGH